MTTATHRFWFKQSFSANPAEGSVHQALSRLAPDLVDAPVGWDTERGWLLTRDGGQTVADRDTADLTLLESTTSAYLGDYARLQLATIAHGPELISQGVPPPADSGPKSGRRCITQMAAYPPNDPRHLTPAETVPLSDALPSVQTAAAALDTGAVPLAFDHNDLFERNVFAPVECGPYRFFDFAESIWAHPFGSLIMVMLEEHRNLDWNGPTLILAKPLR